MGRRQKRHRIGVCMVFSAWLCLAAAVGVCIGVQKSKVEPVEEPAIVPATPIIVQTDGPEEKQGRSITPADAVALERIAVAEAEGESTQGKALVMLVVLNRVADDRFPDTVEGVINQKLNGVYQFTTTKPGGRYQGAVPSSDSLKALEMVQAGWDGSEGALYFDSCRGTSWAARNCEYLFSVGNHSFYR